MRIPLQRERRCAAALALGTLIVVALPVLGRAVPPSSTLFAVQPFPYDFTREALDKVHELAADYGSLAVVHRDNGIPWAEALRNGAFPASVQNEWDDLARRVPEGRPTYLALAPLAEDRVSLSRASEGSSTPASFRGARLNDEAVKTAYLNYARRAVQRFRPRYLNLGVEAGEMAARKPEQWADFAALYSFVRSQLKREYPDTLIGISFGLPSLMTRSVAERVKGLVDESDFLGLSFYPYMSAFYQKFGAAPLPEPPGQWRDALAWASQYTNKPIAICETAYSSRDVDIPAFSLHMKGSPDAQAQYVTDLSEIARRNHYLFVVWSIAVDYDALYKKLPRGDGRYLMWQNVGLFDSELRPRPAWEAWKRVVGARDVRPATRPSPTSQISSEPKPTVAGASRIVGFASVQDLFSGPPSDRIELDDNGPAAGSKAMRWSFPYQKDSWQWIVKELRPGDLAGRKSVRFLLRSDRDGPLFVQLEEQSGETFFTMVNPSQGWQRVSRALSDFTPDPKKRKEGRFDPDQVVKILLADAAGALANARGTRTIWLADWAFD